MVELAVRLGDELLDSAEPSNGACSWKSIAFKNRRNLTGLSHGTAGAGYALLELFHGTGIGKYRETSERAFGYERRWFSAEAGNWPDFRNVRGAGRQAGETVYGTAWCHGAPGIALSRMRAYQIVPDERFTAEIAQGLETTRNWIRVALDSGDQNFCLCHGLTGNASVFLYASSLISEEKRTGREIAEQAAFHCMQYRAGSTHGWPGCFDTLGLMTGWAGIGSFFLHVREGTLPAALLLTSAR